MNALMPRLSTWSSLTTWLLCSGHPAVAKVAFTGSVATGRRVNLAAAANLRPTSMELGGKSAIIVFEDSNVADAVEWVMVSSCVL
jgi:betaine-aldehyde dehydrogenase